MTPGYTSYVGWVPEDTQIFLCCSKYHIAVVTWLFGWESITDILVLANLCGLKFSCDSHLWNHHVKVLNAGASVLTGKALGIEFISYTSKHGLWKYVFDHAAQNTCLIMRLTKTGWCPNYNVSISFNMSQHALYFARFHEARKPHIVSSPVPRLCRVKSRVEWAHPSHLAALRSVGHVVQGCGAAVLSWDSWHVETGLPESLFKSNISNCTESFIHAFLVGSELPWMHDLARNQERRGQAAIQIKHIPLGELQAMPWRPKTWGVGDDWGDNISQTPGDIQSPHTIT